MNQVDNDGFTPLLLACETVAQCKSDKVCLAFYSSIPLNFEIA